MKNVTEKSTEQGGRYPLTAAQKLHFFYQKFCPKKQVLNIGSSLTIQQSLDFDALRQAIGMAYDRCETMRLRFTEDKEGNVLQYIAQNVEPEIEFFDFTGWEDWAAEAKMNEWTSVPFERYDTPLNKIVIIITPDGFQGMYLLVDHMTMDAQSLILFMRDIIELYCHMKYEGIDYPKEMASYIQQLEKDLAYEAGSQLQKKDAAFFEDLISSSEPIFNGLSGTDELAREREREGNPLRRAATNTSQTVDAKLLTFELESEPTVELMQFCEQHHISIACLLMMGLRTYLQKENGNDDVSIVTTVARRATLAEKKSGGTRIHCFPFRTIVKKDETFLEGLLHIREGQNQIFRHANYDPTAFFQYRSKKYNLLPGQTYEPLGLTYQPLTLKDKGLDRLGDIQYKTARYSNGAAAHALYLTVMHRAEDNGMNFNFEYRADAVTEQQLEHLYYYLCRILFAGIANPDMTVGELMDTV